MTGSGYCTGGGNSPAPSTRSYTYTPGVGCPLLHYTFSYVVYIHNSTFNTRVCDLCVRNNFFIRIV